MKTVEILTLALIGLMATGLYNYESTPKVHTQALFESWMDLHGKYYQSEAEKLYRFGVWVENFDFVQQHNARFMLGDQTFEVEMNHFADMINSEFNSKYLMHDTDFGAAKGCDKEQAPETDLPEAVDWSAKGAVTAVKNQGQCGSCWAFSATGSMEGAYFRSTGKLTSFSEQQLVDCSTSYGNHGCGGGLMDFAFSYVMEHGIALESSYRYKGVNEKCVYNEEMKAWTISGCSDVTEKVEKSLMAAVAQQPISVAIQANQLAFQLYRKGVLSGLCGHKLDHGVLAVGYGQENGKKYWKVKNSWGAGWGESGYLKIEQTGDGNGKCGILLVSSFPKA